MLLSLNPSDALLSAESINDYMIYDAFTEWYTQQITGPNTRVKSPLYNSFQIGDDAASVHEGHDEDGPSTSKKRKKSNKSDVWDHFTEIVNEKGTKLAKCNHCPNRSPTVYVKNGTSNMWLHLKTRHQEQIGLQEKPASNQTTLNFKEVSLKPWKVCTTQHKCNMAPDK